MANRIGEIQALTNPDQWRYVSSRENPADLLTKGLGVTKLINEEKWWHGPLFLKQDPTEWPENRVEVKKGPDIKVCKSYQETEQVEEQTFLASASEDRLKPQKYASWSKLARVTTRVDHFIENCRLPADLWREGFLKPDEVATSERHIRQAQQEVFTEEIRAVKVGKELPSGSKLLPLRHVLDDEGILRCDGRLPYAECLPWETCYPIILSRNHWITTLIIKHAHEQNQHAGTSQVLAQLSVQYWIISAREAIREWERECMQCRRMKASLAKQVMVPLPELRKRKSLRAFSHISVDFGGPFLTKQGRGKTCQKKYLCLFTCLETRAVHFKVAWSLDTDAFLNPFYRMTSRRGLPKDVVCDNRTNFVGGSNELKELQASDQNKIQDTTTSPGIKWHFHPPLTPHFSGVHESMIKAVKGSIYVFLGAADITDEELLIAVVGAEGLINSQPLTYQSADPTDLIPLTPNHFLHSQVGGCFALDCVNGIAFNL